MGIRKRWAFPRVLAHVRYHPRSLRVRLAFWNALILVLTLFLLGAVVYTVVTYDLKTSLDRRLLTQGEKLQLATHIWLLTGHPVNERLFAQLVESVQEDEFTSDDLYIKLFDAKTGRLLQYSSNLQQVRIRSDERSTFDAALHGQDVFKTYYDKNGDAVRVLTMPLLDRARQPIAIAQVGRSLAGVRQVQVVLGIVLCAGSISAMLLAYGISFVLTSREIQPLSLLSAEMRNMSVGRLGVRLEPKQQMTEVQLLTEAFNQMSQRLEASFTLQRNFVADVSHELRTPLTALRGQIEVLLMNPDLSSEVRQDVQQVRTELIRLSHLVSNLLAMARVEAGAFPEVSAESAQRVEMDLLLVEIARQARFLNQQVTVQLGQLQQVWTMGEKDLLKQMLLNIVENALAYTPAGGEVEIGVIETNDLPEALLARQQEEQGPWIMISIRDTGPGIAPLDLPHIFERHYRAVRTQSRSAQGAGIGLSLARLIAQAHHGDITVESEVTQGSCFRVWLPVIYEEKGEPA